jgi:hypothetical protein
LLEGDCQIPVPAACPIQIEIVPIKPPDLAIRLEPEQ